MTGPPDADNVPSVPGDIHGNTLTKWSPTMTTTEELRTAARRSADDLAETVERIRRLADLGDRGESAGDQLRDELRERPLEITCPVRVEVLLYTGGPAGGVTFGCERRAGWLDMTSARVWHQDWYTPREYVNLDDDTARTLWDAWGCEFAGGGR